MQSTTDYREKVESYIRRQDWRDVEVMRDRTFEVSLLARGEYNLNYRLKSTGDEVRLVFRVNMGTQIDREDQVEYEYGALRLLAESGVTPRPHFVDDSRTLIDRGILIMDFLPGEPLDYRCDLEGVADLFATLHQVPVDDGRHHLIRENQPLSLIYEECAGLLQRYFDSELSDPQIRTYLGEVLDWADGARGQEVFYQNDPWFCIINTEVNSGNFIVNRKRGTIHLVDWEMPRYGDPSQDLCHFCSPLTTLWKTDFRMSQIQRAGFIERYRGRITDAHLRDTLEDRVRLRDPFVYLRGISWSAMGWVAYQTEFAGMKNPDTWRTLQRYMDIGFIRSIFDPIIG